MSHDDIKLFISNFNQPGQENFKSVGVTFKGEKFMYLSSNEKVARFKKGTSGVHTIKTTQGKFSNEVFCMFDYPLHIKG